MVISYEYEYNKNKETIDDASNDKSDLLPESVQEDANELDLIKCKRKQLGLFSII